jgi:gliding motility-associated-like protein
LAQNNLDVSYTSAVTVPDFINVCGDDDEVQVTVSTTGFSPALRSNINLTIELFSGVSLSSFSAANSSPGVVLIDNSNPNQPVFSLPDLNPTGLSSIEIAFNISADCGYTTALSNDNQVQVFDTYRFNYTLGNQANINETDFTSEYRDAFAVPFFTVELSNDSPAGRVGDCAGREIFITNSSINGSVENLLYTNLQSEGVYVEEISINNQSIPFTKTLQSTGDTLISAEITSAFFENIGNNDGIFNPNENITITEKYCLVGCIAGAFSSHAANWGCGEEICAEVFDIDFVTMGEGAANASISAVQEMNEGLTGYCQMGEKTLNFTNNGFEIDEGFGAMRNVVTGIGLGNNFSLADNAYLITNYSIAGIQINDNQALISLDNHPSFLNDPDGIGGLSDVDGDGYFDDLPLGESFEITINYEFDCSNAAVETEFAEGCTNDFTTSLNGRISWQDNCNETENRSLIAFTRPANNNSDIINFTETDAYAEEDIFVVSHTQSRTVRDFAFNCSNAMFTVRVALPAGVQPEIAATQLLKNESNEINLLSNSISNDTLILVYDANDSPFLNGDYRLDLAFSASCDAPLGATTFPLTFEFRCADCDCNHLWYCGELNGPQLHNRMPPCTEVQTLNCPEGLQTTDFQVNRTSFGFTDNTYTNPINPSDANEKVAISCDAVEMSVKNIVGATALNDNIGIEISYSNPDNTTEDIDLFNFISGELSIIKNGVESNCTVATDQLSTTQNGSVKRLIIDLSNCLTDSNLSLVEGDSVNFLGQFSINPDGPITTQFELIPNFRAEGFAMINGNQTACDNFGENFTVATTQTAFDFPNNDDFPIGCEPRRLQYRLITVNNGFSEFFGDEYRPAIAIDSLVFDFDPNILDAFTDGSIEVSIPGHPIHGDNFYFITPLSDFPNGHYVALFDTLQFRPSLNEVQSYSFNLRVNLMPTCESQTGSTNGNADYNFSPTIYYQDRAYAPNNSIGSCPESIEETVESDLQYANPPVLSLTPDSPSNHILTGDTASWTVQLCNISPDADAATTWLAAEDFSGILDLISMEDVTEANNPISFDIQNYGQENNFIFAETGILFRADGLNSFEQICRKIRIKALVNTCQNTSFSIRAGYNCDENPADWTPEDNDICVEENLNLSVTLRNPFLEAAVIEQNTNAPDICTEQTFTILLRNNDQGAAFNVLTNIILPSTGTAFAPNSFELAYPSNTAFISIPTPTFGDATIQGERYFYSDFALLNDFLNENGLPGFDPNNPSNDNELLLRFTIETDCDFRSGDLISYNFQGEKACGDLTNFEAGETLPIIINGTQDTDNQLFDIEFTAESAVVPNANSTIGINLTNLSSTPSSQDNRITVTLPLGVEYIFNSTQALSPTNWDLEGPSIIDEDGLQILSWIMLEDLEQNETASFTFGISADEFDCEVSTTDFRLATLAQNSVFCEETQESCTIESITSTNGGGLENLPANGNLSVLFTSSIATCVDETMEEILVGGQIVTSSASFSEQDFELDVFFDANQNGLIDSDEILVHQVTVNGAVSMGNALPFVFTFTAPIDQVCHLITRLGSEDENFCGEAQNIIPTPRFLNAGEDRVFCASENTEITTDLGIDCPTTGIYSYSWSAIPPASIADLSSISVAQPILNFTHTGDSQADLQYILETKRSNCQSVFDTITIIRGVNPIINTPATVQIPPTTSTVLMPEIIGGSMPFTYEWSPSESLNNSSIANPTANPTESTDYTLLLTDQNGCTATATFPVTVANPIEAEIIQSDTSICEGEILELTAIGGDTYTWEADPTNIGGSLSSTNGATSVFSGGEAGNDYTYSVIVSNDEFPDFTDTATITITVLLSPTVTASEDITICQGEQGLISALVEASSDAIVSWSPAVNFGQNASEALVSPSSTTDYTVTVTESNGCTSSDIITVNVEDCSCAPAEVSGISIQNSTCGTSEGAITISTELPVENYNFIWSTSLGNTNLAGNGRFNLPFGTYSIRIENIEDTDCFEEIFVNIENEDGPIASASTTDATCNSANGTATLLPANFEYQWADTFIGNERTDLIAGNYAVTVIDPANPLCPNALNVLIGQDNPLSAIMTVETAPSCGEADGSVSLIVSGGSGNYTYSWLSDTNVQENISSGIYNVTISDEENGCILPFVFSLDDAVPNGNLTIDELLDVSCFGNHDGSVTFNISPESGFETAIDTIISNGLQEFENGSLPAGDYCLQLVNPDGCASGSLCFTINSPDILKADLLTTTACEAGGTITTNISGGTMPYTYLWNDLATTMNRENLLPGNYSLTVTDTNGCTAIANTTILDCNCELPVIESVVTAPTLCGQSTGVATISTEGNPSDFTYIWFPEIGVANDLGNSRSELPAGNYSITIAHIDTPTCFTQTSIIIPNGDGPAIQIEVTPAFCDDATGTATLTPSEYTYDWEEGLDDVSFQTGLASGTYTVTVTEPSIPDCPNIFQVTIPESNPLTAEVLVNQQPNCEQANGTVTIEVEGGSGNYGYSWPSNAATQDQLLAGLYSITVTDLNSSNCELPVLFVLTDEVAQAEILVDSINNVSCSGGSDGEIFYEVTTQDGFIDPLQPVISNGIQEFDNGNLPAGSYCIVLRDGNDCVAGGFCFDITEPESLFVAATSTESCGNDGTIDLTVSGGTTPYTFDWPDSDVDLEDRVGLAPGLFMPTITDDNGCFISTEITVDTCNACEIFSMDSLTIQTMACDENTFFCTDLTVDISDFYVITDNDVALTDLDFCEGSDSNLSLELGIGSHFIVAENTITGCTDTLVANILCVLNDTLDIDIYQYEDSLLCFNTEELFTDFDTLINLCPDGQFVDYSIQNDTCLLINANEIGYETACIVVCDSLNICDTTIVNINVLDNNPAAIIDTIIVTQTGTICFDTLATSLQGEFFSMTNICPDESGQFIDYQLNEETFCVNYEGLALGTDNACIEVCDAFNNCDTLNIALTVVPGEFYYDTLFVSANSDTLCLDTTLLEGSIVSMSDACTELNGEHVDFLYLDDTYCVVYTPISAGVDTSCVRLEDEFGNIILINMVITIIETTPDFIVDTIFIAGSDTICLDTSELLASIDFIDDACADDATGAVDFFFNPVTNCVEYTGLDIGKDTACYFICDSLGICDTTYFCILVEEYFDPPVANPDIDTTDRGTPIVIDIKQNDIVLGGITESSITSPPLYGTAIINPDCSVTYLPDPEFCERTDIFSYEICNENGCSIATVEIFINCLDVRVFNVISPNGDGKNDEFYIANIIGKPSLLEIYNRWGNLVFKTEDYANKWPGTYDTEKDLPDGTYYYLLEWSDPDTGEEFFQRGFVELRR